MERVYARLRSGLFHEFKRFGRITSVHIRSTTEDRFGLVFFRLKEHQEIALSSLKGRYFYGAPIEAKEWTEPEPESEEGRLLGKGINPYHYRANRSLFVSNLEETTSSSDLKKLFQRFGDIMKIEVKMVRGVPQYGFVTFGDIISVCNAIKEMDGQKLGSNRLKRDEYLKEYLQQKLCGDAVSFFPVSDEIFGEDDKLVVVQIPTQA
ncbi:msx2-interacting protein-like [Protopterus annectens]|uniref:msx2-interacting protein-like n=1 Tax=Protopterus annectens TaxID=7888 RepID=UPI001CFA7783|nr:msx2-interacting protein-like [Protopterus annectens]